MDANAIDTIEDRCAECGAPLSTAEIEAATDAGGPFLCGVHLAEALPGIEEQPGGPADPPPTP